MNHRFKGWTTGWVHPAVKRGTILWTGQAIVLTGAAVFIIFWALQNPTERLWWAAIAAIVAVLIWVLTSKMIKNLQHEYRYEEDLNTADHSS
jgi:uncharacterized BrkB/YihY/UPF0761 family membrane protein